MGTRNFDDYTELVMKCHLGKLGKLFKDWGPAVSLVAGSVVLLFGVISCRTVTRSVVVLPDGPGAEYIGSKECAQCHEEI